MLENSINLNLDDVNEQRFIDIDIDSDNEETKRKKAVSSSTTTTAKKQVNTKGNIFNFNVVKPSKPTPTPTTATASIKQEVTKKKRNNSERSKQQKSFDAFLSNLNDIKLYNNGDYEDEEDDEEEEDELEEEEIDLAKNKQHHHLDLSLKDPIFNSSALSSCSGSAARNHEAIAATLSLTASNNDLSSMLNDSSVVTGGIIDRNHSTPLTSNSINSINVNAATRGNLEVSPRVSPRGKDELDNTFTGNSGGSRSNKPRPPKLAKSSSANVCR